MAIDVAMLQRLGFPDMLLWLLTFAVVYGLLNQAQLPKSKASRGIISIVLAFIVMISAPVQMISVLSQMSSSLILVIVGILVLMVFFEVAGIKKISVTEWGKDKEGKDVPTKSEEITIFAAYSKVFLIAIIIIAALIFISAGGLAMLGFEKVNLSFENTGALFFIAIVVLAIVWLVSNPK